MVDLSHAFEMTYQFVISTHSLTIPTLAQSLFILVPSEPLYCRPIRASLLSSHQSLFIVIPTERSDEGSQYLSVASSCTIT